MKLFTAEQMRKVDAATAEAGVSTQLLMEMAGRKVAEAALRHWSDAEQILVLCGKGNNGGDGYVAARYLFLEGKKVNVLELARSQDETSSDDARTARAAWHAYDQPTDALTPQTVADSLGRCDLVVDALFGSGLSRPLEGSLADIVEDINAATCPVLSVDVPSGVSSDSSKFIGPHVQATRTVQLAGPKLASAFLPAREAFGRWEVADVGIPAGLLDEHGGPELLTAETVRPWLPTRGLDAHKYTAGTVLVVAGSERYLGAAELASRAAYRAGAGLVTLAAEARLPNSWAEIIFQKLAWDKDALKALQELGDKRAQVRVIGPGLDERATEYLSDLIVQSDAPTVLDAGALTGGEAWRQAVRAHGHCVLTPHAGEAVKLLDASSDDVTSDPLGTAKKLADTFGAVVVLKGSSTVVTEPGGRVWVSMSGHPGMATGGTGDVLSGVIGAWLTHADDLGTRTAAAVYLHGLAGERAAAQYGNALLAGDVIGMLVEAWLETAHSR